MPFINTRTTAEGTSYRVQWRHGGRQHVRTFTTKEHAEQWLTRLEVLGHDEALALLSAPPPPADTPTVAEAVASHIDHLTGVQDGTKRRYRKIADRHIIPSLGDLPLDLLTHKRAAAWVNGLTAKGLSGKSIRNIHSLLSGTATTAVREGHIPENVVRGLRLPETEVEEMIFLDGPEIQQFVNHTPEYWHWLVATLFTTGIRFGEVSALALEDLDVDRGTIRIRRAWKETSGNGHILGPPKSKKARRTIQMPEPLMGHFEGLLRAGRREDFAFKNTQGGPVKHGSFHGHVWSQTVHRFAGDERVVNKGVKGRRRITWELVGNGKRPRIHDARHTFASMAIAAGMSLTQLQRHLGHENIATTSERYVHLYQADLDRFATVVPVNIGVRLLEA